LCGYSYDSGRRSRSTGKERDAETGLDYFGARYFSGAQGRFTSPDAPFADQFVEDPQSWNLYAYTRNNPLRYIDDDGRGAKEFLYGMFNATSTNAVGGIGRANATHPHERLGQRVGDVISFGGGLVEMAFGATTSAGGGAACATGVGCLAGAPAIAAGVAVGSHGAVMSGTALVHLMQASDDAPQSSGSGDGQSKPQSKPEAIVEQIDKGGFKVQQNPKTGTQEGNISISHPSQPGARVNVRVETHPLKPNGPPVRHANVEVVKPGPKNRPRVVENKHIEE
jgi:RHS repeat-associated protein